MNRTILVVLLIIVSSLGLYMHGQITEQRESRNSEYSLFKPGQEIPTVYMQELDIQELIAEDILNATQFYRPSRFGKAFDVTIDIKQQGIVETVPGIGSVWYLKIKSSDALSVSVIFGVFEIPDGAELFLYNTNKTHVVGAITEKNNKPFKVLPIQPIEGEEIVIEYFEPEEVLLKGNLLITEVVHDYKGIISQLNNNGGSLKYAGCHLDINCPPYDEEWDNASHSVCFITINGKECSGSLINNANNDGTPYVLTANHCIGSEYEANRADFYFNYETLSCDGSVSSSPKISSSTLRAHWADSDFSLVELSSEPPGDYNLYWNGWDNTTAVPGAPVVSIHHPAGYSPHKKIAVDDSAPTTSGPYEWTVNTWKDGAVEPGSSGAPFFNANHRVVGQLWTVVGDDPCYPGPNTSGFGKFSSSWDGGGSDNTRLRNWLDPSNTFTELPGLRLVKNITINSNSRVSGDIVIFDDITVQTSADIEVRFEDRFEATGSFLAPSSTTLDISPN